MSRWVQKGFGSAGLARLWLFFQISGPKPVRGCACLSLCPAGIRAGKLKGTISSKGFFSLDFREKKAFHPRKKLWIPGCLSTLGSFSIFQQHKCSAGWNIQVVQEYLSLLNHVKAIVWNATEGACIPRWWIHSEGNSEECAFICVEYMLVPFCPFTTIEWRFELPSVIPQILTQKPFYRH